MLKSLFTAALVLFGVSAQAERAVTEGKFSTLNSIYVSSLTSSVGISTNVAYSGPVTGVGLYTSSNVVANSFYGSGATLTGIPSTGSISGVYFTNSSFSSYSSTVTSALQTKLSSGAIPSGFVDFSTITTALQSKLSSGPIPSGLLDLSTVTFALQTKLSSGPVPSGFIDLSTVTTAIALKANLNGATFTGASGITNQAFTATGASGNIIGSSSFTASSFFGDGSHLTGIPSTGSISGSYLPLSGGTLTNTLTINTGVTAATGTFSTSITATALTGPQSAGGANSVAVTAGYNSSGGATSRGDLGLNATRGEVGGDYGGTVSIQGGDANQSSGNGNGGNILLRLGYGQGSGSNGVFTVGYTNRQGLTNLINVSTIARDGSFTTSGPVFASSASFAGSTITATGAITLTPGAAFTVQGANGNIIGVASVTASAFFGDGSHLTGVVASSDVVSINGSLRGDGTSGSPLGVLSSSVAVLSGGLVLNSQLDSSSVTKQGLVTLANLSGAVPSGSVNFSTITTAIAAYLPLVGGNMTGQLTTTSSITVVSSGVSVILSSNSTVMSGADNPSNYTSNTRLVIGNLIGTPPPDTLGTTTPVVYFSSTSVGSGKLYDHRLKWYPLSGAQGTQRLDLVTSGPNGSNLLRFGVSSGTSPSPSSIGPNTTLGAIQALGYDTAFRTLATLNFIVEGSTTVGSLPTAITFNTTPTGSVANSVRMTITSTGTVEIGTTATVTDSNIQLMVGSSVTISGQLNNGYEKVVNACGAGVTTCTATCSTNKVLTGGGCVSTVSLTGDSDAGTPNSWTCASAIGTITATVYCARLGP